MPVKSLNKVQKHINKKKGQGAPLHENSRDSRRLLRASARGEKIHKVQAARAILNEPYLERIAFLKEQIQNHDPPFPTTKMLSLLTHFTHRTNTDLAKLQSQRRAGRPPSTQEVRLVQKRAEEEKELISGMWIPDLRDEVTVARLKEWNGEWSSLGTMQYVRLSSDGNVRDSAWPPKGSA